MLSQEVGVAPEPHGQGFPWESPDTVASHCRGINICPLTYSGFLRDISEGNMVQGTPPPFLRQASS